MYGNLKNPEHHDHRLLIALFDELIANGLSAWVSYDRGYDRNDEGFGTLTTDKAALLNAVGECDEEHIFVGRDGKEIGWIFLVFGNSPGELISDYTTNMEKHITKTNALAEQQTNAR